jgi:uncharacterized protein
MDQQEIIDIVKKYITRIRKQFVLKLVILYGSFSKDTQHKDSDIDVAVFIDKETDISNDYHKNVVKLFKLREDIDLRIEPNLFYFDKKGYEPASFENYIIQNGIILYKE